MGWNSFHRSFRLNGNKFNSEIELLTYTRQIDEPLYIFLKEWFNSKDYIVVKTSGSTGKPKELELLKKHVINSAKATGIYFNLLKNTTALLCLPVSYIAGKLMIIRALILGWQIDVIEPNSNPLKDITKEYKFSAFTPMQLEKSLDKLNLIEKLIVGGGAVSSSLENKLKQLNTEVYATYGMTETITHIAIKKLNNSKVKPAFFDTLPDVKIYRDDRSCLVIIAPAVSNETIFTNDVVQLVSNKQFKWLGRFDNVINSGGIKLQPEVIENKLFAIIDSRFFVAGIPDELLGEKLILFVEGYPKEIEFCNTSLTKFEKPKEIIFVSKFEETTSGKIQRQNTIVKYYTK